MELALDNATFELLPIDKLIDCINPRSKAHDGYQVARMVDDIKAMNLRVINPPIVVRVLPDLATQLGLKEGEFATAQGNRRVAGVKQLIKDRNKHDLTDEQVERLQTIKCQVFTGLNRAECESIAYDDRFKVALPQADVFEVILGRMDNLQDIPQISVEMCDTALDHGMVPTAGRSWQRKIRNSVDGDERRKHRLKAVENLMKHANYSRALGPAIRQQAVAYFRHDRDSVPTDKENRLLFDAQWRFIQPLYQMKRKTEDAEGWEPITAIELGMEENAVPVITGGNASVEAYLTELIGKKQHPEKTERKGLTKKQKGEFKDLAQSPVGQANALILNDEVDSEFKVNGVAYIASNWKVLDGEAYRLHSMIEGIEELNANGNVPAVFVPIANALLTERNVDKVKATFTDNSIVKDLEEKLTSATSTIGEMAKKVDTLEREVVTAKRKKR